MTVTIPASTPARPSRFRLSSRTREAIDGYLWLSPWLAGFLIFTLGPLARSLYLSFTSYHAMGSPEWIGWQNYVVAFTGDGQFWPSLGRTFYYSVLLVPAVICGALILALLLNQPLRAGSLYRTAYFLPYVTPVVAIALIWGWILHPQLGIANYLLSQIGIEGPAWLSPRWAIPTLVMMSFWMLVGGSRMVVFLAALRNVPQELYEAARIDGAGKWHSFRYITLPLISPAIFFNLIVTLIAALKVFDIAYMLMIGNQGGIASGSAGFSLYFYVVKLFDHAFSFFEMGYASAMAWIFLVILLCITALQFRWSSWVYYAGEEGEG